MKEEIIAIYCICDEFVKTQSVSDWHNVKVSTAEVLTSIVVATRYFHGNYALAHRFMTTYNYFHNSFTYNTLAKRIQTVPLYWWNLMLQFIQSRRMHLNYALYYVVDSFPVAVCKNIRISRCRIYCGEAFRGYNKSKREYFYGLKVGVITDVEGCPTEVCLAPGSEHDMPILRNMEIALPEGSSLFGDSAFTDYAFEEGLEVNKGIHLVAERKSNSLRPHDLGDLVQLYYVRKVIESSFSSITRLMPRKIHSRTPQGFESKILAFVLTFAIGFVIG